MRVPVRRWYKRLMFEIESWQPGKKVRVVRSRGGVIATVNPMDNLVRFGVEPWPTPELLQKLYASSKFKGATGEDDVHAKQVLGHYSDLQSLSSEDALTWSFFGPLIYSPAAVRNEFARALFSYLDLQLPGDIAIWLWRRIPHPEKLESQGGPEIDFGLLSAATLILGEAKWNSALGKGQGVAGNRTQQDLRRAYCDELGCHALPEVQEFAMLGVGRNSDVLNSAEHGNTKVKNVQWRDLLRFMPSPMASELDAYLAWKEKYSR